MVISIIVLLVAAWTGYRLAPLSVTDVFDFMIAKGNLALTVITVVASINLGLWLIGAFAPAYKNRRRERQRRFWP